jgi:tetratricopeptide (TPR) repeat protein
MEVYHSLCLIYSGEYGDSYFDPSLSEFYAKKSYRLKPSKTTKEQLGSIYFQNEKYKEAVNIFKELYSKEPTNKKFQFFLGQCLYFAGNEKLGEFHMKSAAERDEACKLMFQEIFESEQTIE